MPRDARFWLPVRPWFGPDPAAVVPAFDPATGFPWNTPDEAYQSQCWPDPTTEIANAFLPLNATQAQAFNVPDEAVGIVTADDTAQTYAIQPPTSVQVFNVPDEATAASYQDDTAQAYPIQPPAVAAFDPSAGFPWNQDEGERFVQSQIVDDSISWALGSPPLNAVIAQAFNVPDEATSVSSQDDTAQSYAIQPPAVAAFDPAGGFPWPVDDVIVTWPTLTDDTAQAWSVNPPAFVPWNTADTADYQPTPDATVQPWAIVAPAVFDPGTGFPWGVFQPEPSSSPAFVDDAYAGSWLAALSGVPIVTGGLGPTGYALSPATTGNAIAPQPVASASTPTPVASASNPRPQR